MSDYFDALMRTSGLAEGPSHPDAVPMGPGRSSSPDAHGIHEIDERCIVPATPPASTLPPHAVGRGDPLSAPITPAARREPGDRPTAGSEDPLSAARLPSRPTPTAPSGPDGVLAGPERSPQVPPGPPMAHPPSGPSRLQAALRWVAAGESPGQSPTLDEPERGPAPLAAIARTDGDAPRPGAATPTGERGAFGRPDAVAVPPVPAAARPGSQAEVPASLPERVSEQRGARPEPAREDPIEVTIGAIHVRLDAPQPMAAAAPAPAAPPASAPATALPALSRRVLWRI